MLSIILPSIRDISRFVTSIDAALVQEYELIVVSPNEKEIPKTRYQVSQRLIIDKGCPSRCLQRGIGEANGEFVTWGTDDGVYFPDILGRSLDILRTKDQNHGMVLKYTEEGPGTFTGANPDYYLCKSHEASRQPGINPEWKMAPVGMFYTDYIREIGGLDCRMLHMNMNIHNMCYRLQRMGGELHYSPGVVMHCDSNNWGSEHSMLDWAYSIDLPIFKEIHKNFDWPDKIDFDNWKNSPEVWKRYE